MKDDGWEFGRTAVQSDTYWRGGEKIASFCAVYPTGEQLPSGWSVWIRGQRQELDLPYGSVREAQRQVQELVEAAR